MGLPITINTAFRITYSNVFEYLSQQIVSELRSTVRNEFQEGEMKMWDFVGPTSGQWDLPRGADTPNIPTPYSRRKNALHRWNWGEYVDTWDKIKMLKDPTSDIIKQAVAAANRADDERILQAAYATAYTGKEGDTAVLPYAVGECRLLESTGVEVAAGSTFTNVTSTGLTLAKIALIGDLMDNASVSKEDRTIVAPVSQKWYLLGSTKLGSYDYNSVKALVGGELPGFMGFNFKWLPTDRFAVNAECTTTPAYNCCAYQKQSMLLARNKDLTTSVDVMPGKLNSVLAQAEKYVGACRLQGAGVILFPLLKAQTMDFSSTNY